MNMILESLQSFATPSLIWFTIGFVFLVSELLVPSLIVFFFGFGAWTTSLLTGIFELSTSAELLIFLVSSLLYLVLLRQTVISYIQAKQSVDPYSIEDDMIGKVVLVTEAIQPPHAGKVIVNGTHWSAQAEQAIEVGCSVKIDTRDSNTLTVSIYS
jgi:hypothetical protein